MVIPPKHTYAFPLLIDVDNFDAVAQMMLSISLSGVLMTTPSSVKSLDCNVAISIAC